MEHLPDRNTVVSMEKISTQQKKANVSFVDGHVETRSRQDIYDKWEAFYPEELPAAPGVVGAYNATAGAWQSSGSPVMPGTY